jgi:hypothetical protein
MTNPGELWRLIYALIVAGLLYGIALGIIALVKA